MDKVVLSFASIITAMALYFAYTPEQIQKFLSSQGKRSFFIERKGEEVKFKSILGFRWDKVKDKKAVVFESSIVYVGDKSRATIDTLDNSKVELMENSIARFIIQEDLDAVSLNKGDFVLTLRGGSLYYLDKNNKRYKFSGHGKVSFKKELNGFSFKALDGDVALEVDGKSSSLAQKQSFFFTDMKNKLILPKEKVEYILVEKEKEVAGSIEFMEFIEKGEFGAEDRLSSFENKKEFKLKVQIGENEWFVRSSRDENWSGKFIGVSARAPNIQIDDAVGSNNVSIFDESVNDHGAVILNLSFKDGNTVKRRIDGILSLERDMFNEVSSLIAYYDYPNGIRSREQKINLENIAPVTTKTNNFEKNKIIKKILGPLKVERISREKSLPKRSTFSRWFEELYNYYSTTKLFYRFFSGSELHRSTQKSNDSQSRNLSLPFLGTGVTFRRKAITFFELGVFTNNIQSTSARKINQKDTLNYDLLLTLFYKNIGDHGVQFFTKYYKFNYLSNASTKDIIFDTESFVALGVKYSSPYLNIFNLSSSVDLYLTKPVGDTRHGLVLGGQSSFTSNIFSYDLNSFLDLSFRSSKVEEFESDTIMFKLGFLF